MTHLHGDILIDLHGDVRTHGRGDVYTIESSDLRSMIEELIMRRFADERRLLNGRPISALAEYARDKILPDRQAAKEYGFGPGVFVSPFRFGVEHGDISPGSGPNTAHLYNPRTRNIERVDLDTGEVLDDYSVPVDTWRPYPEE